MISDWYKCKEHWKSYFPAFALTIQNDSHENGNFHTAEMSFNRLMKLVWKIPSTDFTCTWG